MVRPPGLEREGQVTRTHPHAQWMGSEEGSGRDGSDPTLRVAATPDVVLIAPALRQQIIKTLPDDLVCPHCKGIRAGTNLMLIDPSQIH